VMKLYLKPEMFSRDGSILLEIGEFRVDVFKYSSGVDAVRLVNSRGQLVMLPYQGQQIWSAEFDGRDLSMKSMFDHPRQTLSYLETYGGFFLHYGVTAMGVPSGPDSHPLHGELPNAPYQTAFIEIGADQNGDFISLSGTYQHTVAFRFNYIARPAVKLYAGSSLCHITLQVENLKNTEMELMYLAHINFRPIPYGRLLYSAVCSPQTVRVRQSIPSHISPKPGYKEFLEELAENPERHHFLEPGLMFDPEVVFMIEYSTDADGWAHSMQLLPDGSADYVAHQPAELDHGIRWICRTPDQEALGLVLPATAEPEGYSVEKAKGNIKVLQPHDVFSCKMIVGSLDSYEALKIKAKINQILHT
jgi:hypothetical protein